MVPYDRELPYISDSLPVDSRIPKPAPWRTVGRALTGLAETAPVIDDGLSNAVEPG